MRFPGQAKAVEILLSPLGLKFDDATERLRRECVVTMVESESDAAAVLMIKSAMTSTLAFEKEAIGLEGTLYFSDSEIVEV
jgi:hypothetical protein